MSKFLPIYKSRFRLPFILIFVFLSACGAGSLQIANGIGGTGITQGRLTAFGSMFVNGVKFNTDNATFIRDGVGSKQQEDFNTGEIVTIKGTVNDDRKTGMATEVIFSDILEGAVTSTPTTNAVEILGQNVTVNTLTVFHGFSKLSDLKVGNIVEISGFTKQNQVTASSIQLIKSSFMSDSTSEIEGTISSLNRDSQSFEINGLVIDYSDAIFSGVTVDAINNGDFLIISSDQDVANNALKATRIDADDNTLEANTYFEIEGFVTEFNSVTNFIIDDNDPIITNNDTLITNGALNDIKLDQFIIATGTTNASGVLIAEEIRIIDSADSISIESNIESINLMENSIVILGQTITVDNFTIISDETTEDFVEFNLSEFAVGDSIFVDASLIDGEYLANRLSKIPVISSTLIISTIDTVISDQNSFVIINNTVSTDSDTVYLDEDNETITAATFFSSLIEGVTELVVEATEVANQELLAVELSILENE